VFRIMEFPTLGGGEVEDDGWGDWQQRRRECLYWWLENSSSVISLSEVVRPVLVLFVVGVDGRSSSLSLSLSLLVDLSIPRSLSKS